MKISFLDREYDIRIRLLLASMAVVVGINAAFAMTVNRLVANHMIYHEGEIAQDFLSSFAGAENGGEKLVAKPTPSPSLQSFSNHLLSLPGVFRANVYGTDGFTLYSTEANLIGVKFQDNAELDAAIKGEIVVDIMSVANEEKSEQLALQQVSGARFVEAYIPIKDKRGNVTAVVEFYRNSDSLNALLTTAANWIWVFALVSTVVTLLLVLPAISGLFFSPRSK